MGVRSYLPDLTPSGMARHALWRSTLAFPLAYAYGRVTARRRERYLSGRAARRRLSRPVVSVGNITVGGTGKTPMTILLASLLAEDGLSVSVLSRGYGGVRRQDPMEVRPQDCVGSAQWREVGDEPLLIARAVPRARVTVGRSRYVAGLMAEASGRVDIHILDDGFQHLELERDLDIVMIATSTPLPRARCLPAGPYRESPAALRFASIVAVKSPDGIVPKDLANEIVRLAGDRVPIISARLIPKEVERSGDDRQVESVSWLEGRKVGGFSGVAEPASFESTLRELQAELVRFLPFPDHHAFTRADLGRLAEECRARGAEALVCTEKDMVRLPAVALPLPILALRCELLVPEIETILARIHALAPVPAPASGGATSK